MKRIITFIAITLVACGGAVDGTDPSEPPTWSCSDGTLVVDGPVTGIMARYPEASPPERLLAHTMSPGMLVTVEADGWLAFKPYEPVPAGGVATVETTDYSTGKLVCPGDVVVERGW
jgi:hypothetical protein